MKYIIQPLNEGQELNYSEIKDFERVEGAKMYAKKMKSRLQKALPEAMIDIKLTMQDNPVIFYV